MAESNIEATHGADKTRLEKSWYQVEVPAAHVGVGKKETKIVYIFAKGPVNALAKVKRVGGWKRHLRGSEMFPNIRQLSDEESRDLEDEIRNAKKISLTKAQKRFYFRETR